MKHLASLVFGLVLAGPALADINFTYTPDTSLYVRVKTSATTSVAVQMVEGDGMGDVDTEGFYSVTDSALAAAGLATPSTGAGHPFKVFVGTAHTSAANPWVGQGTLPWSGSVELPPWADVRRWTGSLIEIIQSGVPRVDVTHLLGSPVCD